MKLISILLCIIFCSSVLGQSSNIRLRSSANSVSAITVTASGTSIPNGSETIFPASSVEFKYGSGSWDSTNKIFTATEAGAYLVCVNFMLTAGSWASLSASYIAIYKDGTGHAIIDYVQAENNVTEKKGSSGCKVISLTAGGTIQAKIYQGSGSAKTLESSAYNYMSIVKVAQ